MEHRSETPPVWQAQTLQALVAKGSSLALSEESLRPIFSSGLSFATHSRWQIDADSSLASAPGSDPAATKHTVTALLGLLPQCQGCRAASRSPAGDLEQHPAAPAPGTMAGGQSDEASEGPTSSVLPQSTLQVLALHLCFAFHLLSLKLLQNYSQSKAVTTRDIYMHHSATFPY